MDKIDRNCAEDFCHPPGAVCTGSLACQKFIVAALLRLCIFAVTAFMRLAQCGA